MVPIIKIMKVYQNQRNNLNFEIIANSVMKRIFISANEWTHVAFVHVSNVVFNVSKVNVLLFGH